MQKDVLQFYCKKVFCNFIKKETLEAGNFIKKEILTQVLSFEFWKVSKNSFLKEYLWKTASALYIKLHEDTGVL